MTGGGPGATRFRPEIALRDIGLPVMNGRELARRLRELPGVASEVDCGDWLWAGQ